MEQHPIPQNVTAYQFRLVGDMTLKQFLELAGGLLLAFLSTRFTIIPVFVRWPLAGVFAFGGVALAFLPVEERPLDIWLINFVKSIYSPTQFLWKKHAKVPDFFNFVPNKNQPPLTRVLPKSPKQLSSFLHTMQEPSLNPIDQKEFATLKQINQLLGSGHPLSNVPLSAQPNIKASLGIKTRILRTPAQVKKEVVVFEQKNKKRVEAPQPKTVPSQPPIVQTIPFPLPPLRVASLYPEEPSPNAEPVFASDIALPAEPETPNLITGMVIDSQNRLISNAILEIRNDKNQAVRAVKTNKLGQFFIATPLLPGNYELSTEHPEHTFDIIKFTAEGKIIPPIKIKARAI